jgi:uncharacterized DUF497 family protein
MKFINNKLQWDKEKQKQVAAIHTVDLEEMGEAVGSKVVVKTGLNG